MLIKLLDMILREHLEEYHENNHFHFVYPNVSFDMLFSSTCMLYMITDLRKVTFVPIINERCSLNLSILMLQISVFSASFFNPSPKDFHNFMTTVKLKRRSIQITRKHLFKKPT